MVIFLKVKSKKSFNSYLNQQILICLLINTVFCNNNQTLTL